MKRIKVFILNLILLFSLLSCDTGIGIRGTSDSNNEDGDFVFIKDGLYVCNHEVTRKEYKEIMIYDPSVEWYAGNLNQNPVGNVNFYMCLVYCNLRSIKENLEPCYIIKGSTNPDDWGEIPNHYDTVWNKVVCNTDKNGYRLPTKAEWEYIAKGGENYIYAGSNNLEEITVMDSERTQMVKSKKPNGYGIYDMSGNIKEWCWNKVENSPSERIMKGGSYFFTNKGFDVFRILNDDRAPEEACYPDYGLRVVKKGNNNIVREFTATAGDGEIKLTWKDPINKNLLGIKIYDAEEVSGRNVSFDDGILIGLGKQEYTFTNLVDGKTYRFKASAVSNNLKEYTAIYSNEVEFSEKVTGVVKKYVCPKDKKEYSTAEEAANCCGVETVIQYVDKVVYKYVCPKDKKEYSTAEEAANCCGVQIEYVDKEVEKIVKKYVCPVDGKEYDTLEEASECCGNILSEAKTYICPNDKKEYATEEDAKNCCGLDSVIIYAGTPVYKYICPGCKTEYNTLKEIDSCQNVKGCKEWKAQLFNWYEVPVDAETGEVATANSTYVYFGVFPKTVLPIDPLYSTVTVDETDSIKIGANTYYKGSDGEWYAKVWEKAYSSDSKYTDKTPVKYYSSNESYRYFKVEPIKWKVLTNDYNGTGNALLLAEDILTAGVRYYNSSGQRTIYSKTVYANNYRFSTIRAYLNGKYESADTQSKTYENKGFLQTAFTATAQEKIVETEVDNYDCENTRDKIFLLSITEATTTAYGFAASNSKGVGSTRIRMPTDYAKANFAYQSTIAGYGGYWWLRSPVYSDSYSASYVSYDGGALSGDYSVTHSNSGVVPALSILLK